MHRRSIRWILGIACPGAITAMFAYVSSLPTGEEEGVNLGAAVLLIWLLASYLVLAVAVVREVVAAVLGRDRLAEPS